MDPVASKQGWVFLIGITTTTPGQVRWPTDLLASNIFPTLIHELFYCSLKKEGSNLGAASRER